MVKDSRDDSTPVDRPLDKVLGKMSQKTFEMKRLCNHRLREDVLEDSRSTPADRPLDEVLGKLPQKTFEMKRLYKTPPRELALPVDLSVEAALTRGRNHGARGCAR